MSEQQRLTDTIRAIFYDVYRDSGEPAGAAGCRTLAESVEKLQAENQALRERVEALEQKVATHQIWFEQDERKQQVRESSRRRWPEETDN